MAAGMISFVQIFEQRRRMIRETEYFFHDGEKVLHKDGFNVLNGGYLFLYGKYFVFDRNIFIICLRHRMLNRFVHLRNGLAGMYSCIGHYALSVERYALRGRYAFSVERYALHGF